MLCVSQTILFHQRFFHTNANHNVDLGLVWEEKPNKRWKPLAVKYSQKLEESYQRQVKGAAPDG